MDSGVDSGSDGGPGKDAAASHPYLGLPARAFWRTAIGDLAPESPAPGCEPDAATEFDTEARGPGFWAPRHGPLRGERLVVLGDGFAGLLHDALAARGLSVLGVPNPASAPSGDLGTPRLVLQLLAEIAGLFTPENPIQPGADGWHDALRPRGRPEGLANPALVAAERAAFLDALRQALGQADRLILCLGRSDHREWPGQETAFPLQQPKGLQPGALPPRVQPNHDALIADLQAIAALLPSIVARPRLLFVTSPLLAEGGADLGADVGLAALRSRALLLSALGEMAALQPRCDLLDACSLLYHPAARGAWADPASGQPRPAGMARLMALLDPP